VVLHTVRDDRMRRSELSRQLERFPASLLPASHLSEEHRYVAAVPMKPSHEVGYADSSTVNVVHELLTRLLPRLA
jgi:hypothetical protein